MSEHELYMRRCLDLAQLGAGNVAPNPMVGAVLVHEGRIIGEGCHQQYGQAHAEVNCINSVAAADAELIPAASIYVSLEPCSHFGKTPPCSDLIISKNIRKVITGCLDPFPAVNGKGIERLRSAGVEVVENVLKEACIELNRRFFVFQQQKRPYIILKWAQSADGRIGGDTNSPTKISNAFTDRLVHKWRSEEAAIMIGTKTAMADDPSLTTRNWKGNDPKRIVIDMDLKLPASLKLLSDGNPTIVVNTIKQENEGGLSYLKIGSNNSVQEICRVLYEARIQSVIIEGGAKLLQSFIDAGTWDEARIICNNDLIIGKGLAAPVLHGGKLVDEQQLFSDSIKIFNNSQ